MSKSKIQTTWDLKLFYKNPNDPQIEKDVVTLEQRYRSFARKYKYDDRYLKNSAALLKVMKDYEKLCSTPHRPSYYFSYRSVLNAGDVDAIKKGHLISDRLTKAANEIYFFEIKLGKIDPTIQKKFLKDQTLKRYHYWLHTLFKESKHHLSEIEEKLMSLKSKTSYGMWVEGVERVASKQEVTFGGKTLPISEALGQLQELPKKSRDSAYKAIKQKYKEIADFAEAELNAVVADKKINDDLRGYKEPYDAKLQYYEISPSTLKNLRTVVDKNIDISKKFYKLKAKMLNVKHLEYQDRHATIGSIGKKFTFEESHKILSSTLHDINPLYEDILTTFVKEGRIDVYPKKGKSGGAFCSHGVGVPTMVMLNHTNDINSLFTLAHEMGHAIHSERSKQQSSIYEGYSTAVAETASTFFETILFHTIFEELSVRDQKIALHNKIQDDIATIFRQIAFFNFEYDLHMSIRQNGFIEKEKISELLVQHMRWYFGPAVKLTRDDGLMFTHIPHFRSMFYVFTYAYGELISKALYKLYKEDNAYIDNIDTFLSAGSSKSPHDIFADIGIDTSKSKVFEDGMEEIELNLKKLEQLVAKK